jgi:hypothetical protein
VRPFHAGVGATIERLWDSGFFAAGVDRIALTVNSAPASGQTAGSL